MPEKNKIDLYKDAVSRAKNIEQSINLCLARVKGGRSIDKNSLQFMGVNCKSGIHLVLDARYGEYGNSSCYDQNSNDLTCYLARAANEMMEAIADRAISLAKRDVITARVDARQDAERILLELEQIERSQNADKH